MEWDSTFFGISIAQLLHTPSIESNLSELRELGVNLVYLISENKLNLEKTVGFFVTVCDRKITYSKNFTSDKVHLEQSPLDISPYAEMHDNKEELLLLGVKSALYSRFNLDPNIPQSKFEELFRLWTEKSLLKISAREVFVAREQGKICGMITLVDKGGIGNIGLLAVDVQYRGRGIGKALILAAQKWFLSNGYKRGTVVTQQDNIPACRLYERCGYSLFSLVHVYHLWSGA